MSRTCRTCGIIKQIEEFPKNGKYRRTQCYVCYNASEWGRINTLDPERRAKRMKADREWKHTPQGKRSAKSSYLKRSYGISLNDWEIKFSLQGNVCEICKSPDPRSKNGWCTDHNHSNGQLRGILCNSCNIAVGNVENGWPLIIPEIEKYLEDYRAVDD